MVTDIPPPKPVRDVAFSLGSGMGGLELAVFIKESIRSKCVEVFAIEVGIAVHRPIFITEYIPHSVRHDNPHTRR